MSHQLDKSAEQLVAEPVPVQAWLSGAKRHGLQPVSSQHHLRERHLEPVRKQLAIGSGHE